MSRIYSYAKNYGKKALILITESGYRRIGDLVEISFQGEAFEIVFDYFHGECSKRESHRLTTLMEETNRHHCKQ